MKILALNGYRSPVLDDFQRKAPHLLKAKQVICPYVNNWTGSNAELEFLKSTMKASQQYTVAGFSDGCLPAYRLACKCENIAQLVIHSGMWHEVPTLMSPATLGKLKMRDIPLHFFITAGDRTPTRRMTRQAYEYFKAEGYNCQFYILQPTETRGVLHWLNHEFQNAIPDLIRIAGL